MVKSQLKIKIAKGILDILQSKNECKSTFQLNKYIFFINTVKCNEDFNSHDLYQLIKCKNNAQGAKMKQNLIDWGIIEKIAGVYYVQNTTGKIQAAGCARYQLSTKFMFDKKVECVLVSDRAKFINHPSIYSLTYGAIVEVYKEVKQRNPRTKKTSSTDQITTPEASSAIEPVLTPKQDTNITEGLKITARNGVELILLNDYGVTTIELIKKHYTKGATYIPLGSVGFFTVENLVVTKKNFKAA